MGDLNSCRDMNGRSLHDVTTKKKRKEMKSDVNERDVDMTAEDCPKKQRIVEANDYGVTKARESEKYKYEKLKGKMFVESAFTHGFSQALNARPDLKMKTVESMEADVNRPRLHLPGVSESDDYSDNSDEDSDSDEEDEADRCQSGERCSTSSAEHRMSSPFDAQRFPQHFGASYYSDPCHSGEKCGSSSAEQRMSNPFDAPGLPQHFGTSSSSGPSFDADNFPPHFGASSSSGPSFDAHRFLQNFGASCSSVDAHGFPQYFGASTSSSPSFDAHRLPQDFGPSSSSGPSSGEKCDTHYKKTSPFDAARIHHLVVPT